MTSDEVMALYKVWSPQSLQLMHAFFDAIADKTTAEGARQDYLKATHALLDAFFAISNGVHELKYGVPL